MNIEQKKIFAYMLDGHTKYDLMELLYSYMSEQDKQKSLQTIKELEQLYDDLDYVKIYDEAVLDDRWSM